MTFTLLFTDEIRGLLKSKLMYFLWIGMPLIAVLVYSLQPNMEGMPFTTLSAMLFSTLGGSLSGVMLATTIRSELNARVYDLYLIRPVRRGTLLVAKYAAVFAAMLSLLVVSIAVGAVIDAAKNGLPLTALIDSNIDSLVVSLSAIAISSALGMLLGLIINSVPASAIVSFYLCNQISGVIIAVALLVELPVDLKLFAGGSGLILSAVLLGASLLIFRKKRL